jgi:hypothetical protein
LKGPAKFIRPLRGVFFDSVAFDLALSTSESGFIASQQGSELPVLRSATR